MLPRLVSRVDALAELADGEIAIGACDLAEVLGSAVALNLLFHIPLFWAVIITGLDVLLLLALQRFGMRTIEAIVLLLVATIGVCYFIEIFVLPQTQPSFLEMGRALITPTLRQAGMIYVAIGIIGATVMPHVLYLHSALVQSRKLQKDEESIRSAIRFNTIDSIATLSVAFFVNAAILVLAAIVFYGKTSVTGRGRTSGPVQRQQRLDSRRLSDSGAAAGHGRRQHAVRRRAAGQRAKQHHHRHAGRPGGDGRLHALADQAVGAAAHHPHAGHHARGPHHRPSRRQQRHRSAHPEPGGAGACSFRSRCSRCCISPVRASGWEGGENGWFLLTAGWGSALLITAMDFYGLPEAVKSAWQVVSGG